VPEKSDGRAGPGTKSVFHFDVQSSEAKSISAAYRCSSVRYDHESSAN
jgi:hypothetical protein